VDTTVTYDVHMDVGVRELKQHLSEFLDRAEKGEIIRVTDRGRPKALIGPMPGEGRLEQGRLEGWVSAASRDRLPRAPRRARAATSTVEALAEDRSE